MAIIAIGGAIILDFPTIASGHSDCLQFFSLFRRIWERGSIGSIFRPFDQAFLTAKYTYAVTASIESSDLRNSLH